MATATSRYRFVTNTSDVGPQLECNWRAIIPRVEKTYGNRLFKAIAPDAKVGGTTWAQRLAVLRERLADEAVTIPPGLQASLYGQEAWLLRALLHDSGRGEHPGTSILTVEFEPLAKSRILPTKSDYTNGRRLLTEVLRDYAPDSDAGRRSAAALGQKSPEPFAEIFLAVVRADAGSRQVGTWSALGPTSLLAPFVQGAGKAESYGC